MTNGGRRPSCYEAAAGVDNGGGGKGSGADDGAGTGVAVVGSGMSGFF